MKDVRIVAITGGSCSGKTTLVEYLATRLSGECARMALDDYYIDQPAAEHDNLAFNFDHPDSLDFPLICAQLDDLSTGSPIESPCYDFVRHRRLANQTLKVAPAPLVLIDGILLLSNSELRKRLDYAVYVRCPSDLRLKRRLARDVVERGRKPENIRAQFRQQVNPMHEAFVSPSRAFADRVLSQSELDAVLGNTDTTLLTDIRGR